MKQRVILFFTVFFYFTLIFVIEKAAFVLVHSSLGGGISFSDIISALYHGLPLDISMSGYLTVIPALIIILSIWFKRALVVGIFNFYYVLVSLLIATIAIADFIIYPYWGFHIDSSVFLYLQKPKEAFASVSGAEFFAGIIITLIFAFFIYLGYIYLIRKRLSKLKIPKVIWKTNVVMILLTAALFLPIRGGISVSTMNVGKVYFSDNIFLNHAAINPQFNLFYSLFKSDKFGSQYQFFDKKEATHIFEQMVLSPTYVNDSIPQILTTDKPNIILFVLESFSSTMVMDSAIAPNMCRFAKEGIYFDNFYANSFRTDRGLVSVLSGYPAHPTAAIIKYPQKTGSLPAITKSLKQKGYDNLSFYYGGDADFANMRSYFVSACGITDIMSDKSFPMSQRFTKWGAPDKFVFDKLYIDLTTKQQQEPFVKTLLTLSSHEPFDVPVHKFGVPFLNAISYTDQCLGNFIDKFRKNSMWDNTLIILIADHAMQSYPKGMNNSDPKRFHIPMIWLGGAVKEPKVISDYGSQNDLAATLLSQLNIEHSDYKFSKDMLDPRSRKFAFYSYVNGFCMTDSTGTITYDNDKRGIVNQSGNPDLEKEAKAFFQNMYIDLGSR